MNPIKLLIAVVILAVVGIIIYTLYAGWKKPYRPPEPTQLIMPVSTGFARDRTCTRDHVVCNTDKDCNVCIETGEGTEMKCQSLSSSGQIAGKSKYCLPVRPVAGCNAKTGGAWVWGGDSGWDCFCQYPDYYTGGTNCGGLNPDICSNGGTQASPNGRMPTPQQCSCPDNYTAYVRTAGMTTPLCLENKIARLYADVAKV